jgi:hypothetical protein
MYGMYVKTILISFNFRNITIFGGPLQFPVWDKVNTFVYGGNDVRPSVRPSVEITSPIKFAVQQSGLSIVSEILVMF